MTTAIPTFTENTVGAIRLAASGTVSDVDTTAFTDSKLTAAVTNSDPNDQLLIARPTGGPISFLGSDVLVDGTAIGTITQDGLGSTPLEITLNSSADAARVTTLLRHLAFRHVGDNPTENTRSITVQLTEADATASITRTKQIAVDAIEDFAVLTGGGTTSYTPGAVAIALNPGGKVADADSPGRNMAGVTLNGVWTTGGSLSGNRLAIAAGSTFVVDNAAGTVKLASDDTIVIANFNVGGGIGATDLNITFTADATVSHAQTLFRLIRFRTSPGASTGQRVITFTLDDGGNTTTAVNTVNVP